jgi:hypothetical protein
MIISYHIIDLNTSGYIFYFQTPPFKCVLVFPINRKTISQMVCLIDRTEHSF